MDRHKSLPDFRSVSSIGIAHLRNSCDIERKVTVYQAEHSTLVLYPSKSSNRYQRMTRCWMVLILIIMTTAIRSVGSENCDFDCLYPRRPETEEIFNKLGHHERTADIKEMMEKLQVF